MVIETESIVVPKHGQRIDSRKALVVAAGCWLGFAAMVYAVAYGLTTSLDQTGLLFWRDAQLHPRGSVRVMEAVRDITALGGTLLRNLFAIMAAVALLFLRLRREATLLAATVTLAWIVNAGMKLSVGRPRPEIVPHLMEAGGNSFPSGHSFNAAVVYISIALAFAAISRQPSVRTTIIAAAILISMVIAWSRVWLGVHWPSDVIAGWLGGAGWAFLASTMLYRSAGNAVAAVTAQGDSQYPETTLPPR